MGWVSKKVYAILANDEEGKKILEGIGEKDQDTVDKEVDGFFDKTGQSNPDKAKQSANPKKEGQPKAKEPDQPKQEQAKASGSKYYRHPDVDGTWHDTGKTFERNGETYRQLENEEGTPWGVSERFFKQFEEAEEPKHPFKFSQEEYPDVETTPYGFIYNVGNSSITDLAAQEKSWGRSDDDIEGGFSVTKDGEEIYFDTFDEAYKAAKESGNEGIPSEKEAEISEALMDYSWQIGESDTVGSFAESIAEKTGYSKDDVLKVIRSDNPNISESDNMAKVAGLGNVENDEDFERSWGPQTKYKEGQLVKTPDGGIGKVIYAGEDGYDIEFSDGVQGSYTEDELKEPEGNEAGDSDYESSVQFLKEKGYTDEQARGMVKGLIEDTEESDIDPTPEYIENYTKTFYNDGGFKEPNQSESINIPYHDGIKGKIVGEENGVVKVEYETKDGITRTDQFYREEIDKANQTTNTIGGKYDAQVKERTDLVRNRTSNKPNPIKQEKEWDRESIRKRGNLTDEEVETVIQATEKSYPSLAAREPAITQGITESAEKVGGKMDGLDYRLKRPSSLAAKIGEDVKDGKTPEMALSELNDAIRYTATFEADEFVKGYNDMKKDLESKGYKEVRCKNFYEMYDQGTADQKAVQCVYEDPKGNRFELQFHTPESAGAKDLNHPLYEEWRQETTPDDRKDELSAQMREHGKSVPNPKGIESIKSYSNL